MSNENENRDLVIRFYDALVKADFDAAAAMCHDQFVFYSQIDTPRPGVAGFMEAEKKHLDVFDNMTMTVESTVAEGDRVAAYVVVEGDQVGEYYGVPPQGAHLRMSMLNLFTIIDGKIIEKRAHYDRMDHVEQLRAEGVQRPA